jgi:hypothetical protein
MRRRARAFAGLAQDEEAGGEAGGGRGLGPPNPAHEALNESDHSGSFHTQRFHHRLRRFSGKFGKVLVLKSASQQQPVGDL